MIMIHCWEILNLKLYLLYGEHLYAVIIAWHSENNFQKSVLSIHHACLGDQTQVVSFGGECLPWLSPLPGPP